MFDSFFLDDEIKNITNPKMSRKLKIDKLKINFFVKIYSSLFFGSFLKKTKFFIIHLNQNFKKKLTDIIQSTLLLKNIDFRNYEHLLILDIIFGSMCNSSFNDY